MWQNPLTHPMFARLSLHNKMLLAVLIGFALGALLTRGGGVAGRYQFNASNPKFIIDTQTGDIFEYSSEKQAMTRTASIPWH